VEVSVRLGKVQSFVSYIERGQRRVDFIELLELAELYKRPLTYFIPR
jgi:transcriptional regulator with XRE-family HTH domain